MARLKDIQDTLHTLLRGELSPEEAARALGVRTDRLSIYSGFVRDHMRAILVKNFPTLKALLPEATWEALDEGYFQSVPAHHWELNECARAFADYVEARFQDDPPPEGLTAFHVELASFEWEEFATYVSNERIPTPDTLDAPALNPTLNILQTSYPLYDFLLAWRNDREPDIPEPLPQPETVFLFQDPGDFRLRYRKATPELLFAIKMTHDGLSIADAAAASGYPEDAVRAVIDAAAKQGVVILPSGT